MTAQISDYNEVFYTRNYSNDLPDEYSPENVIKRIALASIPFLTLHQSFKYPVSLISGGMRVYNNESLVGIVIAIIALAGAIFEHRIGMGVTTIHDIIIEVTKLIEADDWEKALICIIKLANNLLFLALITWGGLELSIISLMFQGVLNLIEARDEFEKDHWIEGTAKLLMGTVRLKQGFSQYGHLKRQREIEGAMKKYHVGKLHENWRFPSDHLPIGIEVDGVRIISWNVLNQAYMEWVTDMDSQGLNGSMISDLLTIVDSNGLTMRDVFAVDMIENMMSKGEIVTLQECSEPFLQHLQARLPNDWDIIKSFKSPRVDQDVILYNKTRLNYKPSQSETSRLVYPSSPGRPVQNAYFSNTTGKDLRIINAHIPGDPALPAREELAHYVHRQHTDGSTTVALGDCNFERDEMVEAYRKAGFREFSLHSPWKTNIDPYSKESKGIDHAFVIGGTDSRDLSPGEVLSNGNLQETIELLNQARG